jgi:hypothetical protein
MAAEACGAAAVVVRAGRPRKGRDARLNPTLGELGISKQQSSDWQKLAAIPEAEFERRLAEGLKDPRRLTTARILSKPPRQLKPCPHCRGTGTISVS